MPRAIVADEFGPPEAYAMRDHEPAAPGPGQIRLAIKAIGVSYVDVLTAAGKYQMTPQLPFIPGSECAGVVEALGEGVTRFSVGDRVMGSSFGGVFADAATVRAASFNRVPAALSLEEAAVLPPSYLTSFHALVDRAGLQPGEALLVLGAAGATGIAAIQIGKHLGARVVASASTPDKRALCIASGADAVVDARAADWRQQVNAAALGHSVDVVFDPVGGPVTEPAFRALGYGGRHLVIGFTGGMTALKTNLPLIKAASLIGVQLRSFGEIEPDRMARTQTRMLELAALGVLRPAIARSYRFEDYAEAMRAAFAGESAGRIVMRTSQS